MKLEYHSLELDEFVAAVDILGEGCEPYALPELGEVAFRFDTKPDQSLDPFSEEYFRQQVALYGELSGRALNQEQGELTPLDVEAHTGGSNPYRSRDASWIARHARTIHTSLMLANLPKDAAVLDAGCGWGLSTEAIAFCGATVTALDINPLFVELVRRRSERLGLPVTTVRSEFDTFETAGEFDLLFFYECLHHSLKPWETLARLGRFVKPDGRIVFAGEPINADWWQNWGLRLDPLSVYCIRKFGWWESGWTTDFIGRCFAKAGFALSTFEHIGLDNGIVGFACRNGREATVVPNATSFKPYRMMVAAYEQRLAAMEGHIANLKQSLAEMQSSSSWRVTAPMRALTRRLGRGRPPQSVV